MGCMLPSSGGEQAYLDIGFERPKSLFAFLFCWCMIVCIRPGSAAADSVIFGKYMMFPFVDLDDQSPWLQRGIGMLCISSITLMNILSTKLAVKIHDLLTIVKIIIVSMISFSGLFVIAGK